MKKQESWHSHEVGSRRCANAWCVWDTLFLITFADRNATSTFWGVGQCGLASVKMPHLAATVDVTTWLRVQWPQSFHKLIWCSHHSSRKGRRRCSPYPAGSGTTDALGRWCCFWFTILVKERQIPELSVALFCYNLPHFKGHGIDVGILSVMRHSYSQYISQGWGSKHRRCPLLHWTPCDKESDWEHLELDLHKPSWGTHSTAYLTISFGP